MTLEPTRSRLPRSAPEAQGIASTDLLAFIEEVEENIRELHGLVLVRHGHVVAEGWWEPYDSAHRHTLFSLTKSFTSTAAGLAIAEGLLALDDTVLSFFPEDAPESVSENLAAMRVRHLLAMCTGHAEDTGQYLFRRPDNNSMKGFLERPVKYAPGTHFLYNNGASHAVSAIVQKVTGTKIQDYLMPRLFEPLGISDVTWEIGPGGINTGGWGLDLTTEEIAQFGQLYLQKGVWEGSRLLPEGWVEQATAFQVSNGDKEDSDWSQGYGFQFWRCRHGAFRGDGAFGQCCVVLPEQEAVVAITAGVRDMQAVLNLVWKHLLPALQPAPLPPNTAEWEALKSRLAGLRLRTPEGQPSSPRAAEVSGKTYRFETNEQKLESVTFDFGEDKDSVRITDDRGEHRLVCGRGGWVRGMTELDSQALRPVASSGAWTDAETYTLKLCFYETPFCPTITCRFEEDRLRFDYCANVAFGPRERPQLIGTALL